MEAVDQRLQWLTAARTAMETEARAILTASERLQASFLEAVDIVLCHPGKLIVTGLGKSGHVARKIVATLRSTGTPSVFLHPVEAAHGDLGLCQPGDPILMISKSGATAALMDLVHPLRELQSQFIGILGNVTSPLAAEMDVVLDASVQREADPESFTPTASSAVALALGHALAVALMQARGFTAAHFGRYHPEGQLGRNLRVKVSQVMHSGDEVAWVELQDSLKQVVIAMSARPLGAACVVSEGYKLAGLITDGDVRRALQRHDDIRPLRAAGVMTASPITIGPDALVHDALCLMEDRPSQIHVLPVVEASGRCAGLIRLHDMYHPSRGSR